MTDLIKIESISQFHEYLGYSKPYHPLITVIDFLKITCPPSSMQKPFVASFYSINFKNYQPRDFQYGHQYYDFEEGALMFVAPGQVISPSPASGDVQPDGWGLFFHPDLIRRSTLGSKIKAYTFFSYAVHEALHVSDHEKSTINTIIKNIQHEYEQNIDVYSQDLIISNIELLLNYCQRFYGRQFITRSHRNKDVLTQFEALIENYFESGQLEKLGIPSVKFCADAMNFSPNYLSDLLKKETGKNTQEHIHYYLIEKAKTMLLSSNSTVSEVAYALGFEYPQYFSKLFRSKTGMSPGSYRHMQ